MKLLKQKATDIQLIEGEDLNIENMKKRIITKAWYDTARFDDVTDIAIEIGMGTRMIFFYARKLKLPKRSGLK
jgi:hypothetical protein